MSNSFQEFKYNTGSFFLSGLGKTKKYAEVRLLTP